MRQPIVLFLIAAMSAGCQLPQLPSLPRLPAASEVLPVRSSGDTLKQAYAKAREMANVWSPTATLVGVNGSRLDPGGRNGGYKDGAWLMQFNAVGKKNWLQVVVSATKTSQIEIVSPDPAMSPFDAEISGLLDSPDAVAKAGLLGRSYTVILRRAGIGLQMDVLVDGSANSITVDAKTGNKVD